MRKEFKRFWKWYKEEIPEVRSYSGKTEENFEEIMKEDFSVKERTGKEKEKIRYRIIKLIESMRYDKSPEKMTKEIIETVLGMIAASNKFTKKGKAARDLYREYLTSGTEGSSTDNRSGLEKAEKDMSEESRKPETYDRKEDDGIITIHVNKDGIFRVTGTGKEIKIRVDTEDFGNKLSGKEVTELCNKTEEEMEPVFKEIDRIIRELWKEKDEITLLEELKNNTEETYNKKEKGRETYENEITEFEDPVENIINMGDFGIPKISDSKKDLDSDLNSDLDSEKDSEKEFGESEEESQELESEEVENYSESESEEELVIVNPPVNMALNIIQVENFDGENVDAERWLKKFTRAATANNWVGDARVGYAAAKLDGSAAEWFEKDQELPDANGGRINAWDNQTDVNTIARSFVTKFKAEFISEEEKKDVKSEEIDELTKAMKEMKIQLMKSFNGGNSYEKRNRGYNNDNRREIICYKCGKKGHYSSNCEEEGEMKCYNCGKNGHMAKACKNKGNQTGYSAKNRERNLNYIGIHSSEGRRIREDESSSDEDDEKRVYPISTRKQKYGNADTNIRRNRTNDFQRRKMDKLAEDDKRRLNSESRRELELLDGESEDEVMTDIGNKRLDGIKKVLEAKRKKNRCKRCRGIGHFVPDCLTLTEKERKWHDEERERKR